MGPYFETHLSGTAKMILDLQARVLKAEGKLAEIGRVIDNDDLFPVEKIRKIVDGK